MPTNKDRAERARPLLDAYTNKHGASQAEHENLTDMIADILHLAHQEGYEAVDVLEGAKNQLLDEIEEEDKEVTVRLVLDVSYRLNGADTEKLRKNLEKIVEHADNTGLLSDMTEAELLNTSIETHLLD